VKLKTITDSQYQFLKWILEKKLIEEVYSTKMHFSILVTPDVWKYFNDKRIINWSTYKANNGEFYIKITIYEFTKMIKMYQQYIPNSTISQNLNIIRKDFIEFYKESI